MLDFFLRRKYSYHIYYQKNIEKIVKIVRFCQIIEKKMSLTIKQNAALSHLIASGNITETAEYSGVSRETIYQWLELPEFNSRLAAAGKVSLMQLVIGSFDLIDDAMGTVKEAITLKTPLDSDEARTLKIRLSASNELLARVERLSSTLALTARLAEVEEAIKNDG